MPTTYKILGQVDTGVTNPAVVYTVSAGMQTIVSSIVVANRSSTNIAGFRVSVNPNGTGPSPEQYLYYDVPIAQNDTFIATVGITMDAADTITVEATGLAAGNISFQVFGSELT